MREMRNEIARIINCLQNVEKVTEQVDTIPEFQTTLIYNERTFKALEEAFAALENADKYGWHDLRKNPDDLPKPGSRIEFMIDIVGVYDDPDMREYQDVYYTGYLEMNTRTQEMFFYNDDHNAYITDGGYPASMVLGWRYIQPFLREV